MFQWFMRWLRPEPVPQFPELPDLPTSSATRFIKAQGLADSWMNVAIPALDKGSKVLVIDVNLGNPTLHTHDELLGTQNDFGLAHYLVGRARVREIIQKTGLEDLYVIPAGPAFPHPEGMLLTPRMRDLLRNLSCGPYEMVIFYSAT